MREGVGLDTSDRYARYQRREYETSHMAIEISGSFLGSRNPGGLMRVEMELQVVQTSHHLVVVVTSVAATGRVFSAPAARGIARFATPSHELRHWLADSLGS